MANNRSTWNRKTMYDEDSKFEHELRSGIFKDLLYHPTSIPYTIEHKYHPDWVVHYVDHNYDKSGNVYTMYIEAKGAFRESSELAKYLAVAKQLSEEEELVFVFQKPHAPLMWKKKKPRKDGTVQTHAEWAKTNGFKWFDVKGIEEFLNTCQKPNQ